MNVTLHLGSWLVPTIITIISIIGGMIVAAFDGKGGRGDYGLPIFSLVASIGAALVIVTSWAVFIALKILQ